MKPAIILFALSVAISCHNSKKDTQSNPTYENEMTDDMDAIISEAIAENEYQNTLDEIRNIIEALDKSILIDKTTAQELAKIFPIDLQNGDDGKYRIDKPYSDYKIIHDFSFEEGVLNSIICSSAHIDRSKKAITNRGSEILNYLTEKLGKPTISKKEQQWKRAQYNIVFRDIHFYEDGNWTLWIQSHKDYFPKEFLPEE